MPPEGKGGEILTCILPACQRCSRHLFPHGSEEANGGGGRGKKRPFLWISSLCMAHQGISPPAQGAPPHPHRRALQRGLRQGAEPGRRQPPPPGNAEQISSRWDRGHVPLLAGQPALRCLLLLLFPPAPSISALQARPGSVSRKAAGNPPSPNLVVLRPCQPGCDFCPSGAGTEVLWRPPGYVPAPGLSTHPGLWLPGYEQRWCGPTGCTLASIAPSQDPLLSYTATWEANPYNPASQPV